MARRTGYTPRESAYSLSPDLLNIFQDFAEKGDLTFTFPSRRQANSLRIRLYRARLMLQRQAQEQGDEFAAEIFASAQYIYSELDPVDAGANAPSDPWRLHIIVDPLARITHGDKLPWKEENEEL
jgi:hypothetical protein